MVRGKPMLRAEELDQMAVAHFQNETFANSMGILIQIAERIPQTELPDATRVKTDQLLTDRVHDRALPVLEAIMYFLRLVGGSPSQKLTSFAAQNLDHGTLSDFQLLQGPGGATDTSAVVNTLDLQHVEALYHALEDVHAPVALGNLEEKYCEPLSDPEELQAYLRGCARPEVSELGTLLARFMLRVLRPGTAPPFSTDYPLNEVVEYAVRIPQHMQKVLEGLPDSVCVKHARTACAAIRKIDDA